MYSKCWKNYKIGILWSFRRSFLNFIYQKSNCRHMVGDPRPLSMANWAYSPLDSLHLSGGHTAFRMKNAPEPSRTRNLHNFEFWSDSDRRHSHNPLGHSHLYNFTYTFRKIRPFDGLNDVILTSYYKQWVVPFK